MSIKIERYWDNELANFHYRLVERKVYFKNNKHSCYICENDWSFIKKHCSNNVNSEEHVMKYSGNKEWAERQAKFYNVKIEDYANYSNFKE